MSDSLENYLFYKSHEIKKLSPILPEQSDDIFINDLLSMESPIIEMDMTENSTNQFVNMIEQSEILNVGNPKLKIIIQPVEKFRFRYKSEMTGTHGSLLGEREDSVLKKEVPTVQLTNFTMETAIIRCTLVTADENRRFPHAHRLVRKSGNTDKDDPHDIEVTEKNNYTAMFCTMGIIHTAKKNIKDEIIRKKTTELKEEKKRNNITDNTITTREYCEMKLEAEQAQKWINLNSVALCFQAFIRGDNQVLIPITEKVYSRTINNLKSALTGELKICRIDKHSSTCVGNEEVWLLVEKVGKKNIKVKFFEVDDEENVVWEAEGRFSELDVHHQYAIVIKTPPYKDIEITTPKEVFLQLERPSDGEVSNILKFVYQPTKKVLNNKRLRLTNPNSEENHNLKMPVVNEILDNSKSSYMDLKKILEDDKGVYSSDFKDHFNSPLMEDLLQLISEPNSVDDDNLLPENLVTDCAPDTVQDHVEFAKESLENIVTVLKEIREKNNSQEAIEKLQELLQETTCFGDSPLHFALRYEQYQTVINIITILAVHPSLKNIVNLQNSSGKTALHFAVLLNKPGIVRALLKLGADLNLCDEEDSTPLHLAIIAEANSCIDELLKFDGNINLEAFTESGWSALHLAAKIGSLHAVRALVEANADVNSTDMTYGRSALHLAVDYNHKHVVAYLLKNTKIDVNLKNYGDKTALHSAVVKGGKCAKELVKLLKEHGADQDASNEESNENTSSLSKECQSTLNVQENQQKRSEILLNSELSTTIKTEENSDNESRTSSNLAQYDDRLDLLNREPPPNIMHEELDLKEELLDDDIPLGQHFVMNVHSIVNKNLETTPGTKKRGRKKQKPVLNTQQEHILQRQVLQLDQRDDVLDDVHYKRLIPILDKTGDWEKLAQHMNQGSLVRLLKKCDSPSKSLFKKITLTHPSLTIRQMKKLLIEVKSFEAATELEKKMN